MALNYAPATGCLVVANYGEGFREPEMVKSRLAIVISPPIKARAGLCTIVPLSTTDPDPPMPYHVQIDVPFEIPRPWGNIPRWVKGDMVNSVGLHRLDLLRLGKDRQGNRILQKQCIPPEMLRAVRAAVLHGLGLERLTGHL